MSDRHSVDTDQMRQSVPGFDSAADTVRAAAANLESEIAAADGCWGADKFGEAFASSYGPRRDDVLARVDAVAGDIDALGDGVRDAGDTYDQNEQDAAHYADQ